MIIFPPPPRISKSQPLQPQSPTELSKSKKLAPTAKTEAEGISSRAAVVATSPPAQHRPQVRRAALSCSLVVPKHSDGSSTVCGCAADVGPEEDCRAPAIWQLSSPPKSHSSEATAQDKNNSSSNRWYIPLIDDIVLTHYC